MTDRLTRQPTPGRLNSRYVVVAALVGFAGLVALTAAYDFVAYGSRWNIVETDHQFPVWLRRLGVLAAAAALGLCARWSHRAGDDSRRSLLLLAFAASVLLGDLAGDALVHRIGAYLTQLQLDRLPPGPD